MHARIPLDVDLEDKLIYGLTPTRLAYLVIALLAAFATWSEHWAPTAVRAPAALLIAATGAAAAWGRWRGRAIDGWALDLANYFARNYRLRFTMPSRH
ncbi:MAG TPA: PrgI family protein [Candidatus Dormibacteraeota bacterium]|nr:PrgI family protein [Candidatus Dormibacteraeota bacterium]